MVTNNHQLDLTFGALADPIRRAILARLIDGSATVGELARPFDVSRPAVSKHLRVLERAGLVNRARDGRVSRCGLDASPMRDAAAWVERYRKYWERQLDSLSRYLERDEPQEEEKQP
jgi:DNA-binding transcriptional ArsR family regulator